MLHDVAKGAQWVGTDEFLSCVEWAGQHEAWLRFLKVTGGLSHYMPRLKGPRQRRDEAFAEIAPAFFFATKGGMPVFEWEPLGANGKRGRRYDPRQSPGLGYKRVVSCKDSFHGTDVLAVSERGAPGRRPSIPLFGGGRSGRRSRVATLRPSP